ncbi:MAG: hypothetical protein SX243_18095 [Acidobacteriota bacterium]|nr:hypothetical protein [Acidobacteriota bacterium]
MKLSNSFRDFFVPITSVLVGAAYGLFCRLFFASSSFEGYFGVMTLGFLFGVPLAIGVIGVLMLREEKDEGWISWLMVPLGISILTLVVALLLAWEGMICIVIWSPLFVGLAVISGLVTGFVRKAVRSSRSRQLQVMAVAAVLPFALTPAEHLWTPPQALEIVENRIEIAAPAAAVWEQIREVPAIAPEELAPSFVHRIGFPRPIAATLEGEGVGAVRHATFEGGILFVEEVTEWQPERVLAFSIHPENVPPKTFDRHVAVGGPYFDVLDGRYELEVLGPQRTLLRLSSTHRLNTRFNGYTRLWTRLFMSRIQDNILQVVAQRSEA